MYYASSATDRARISRFEHRETLPIEANTETIIWEDPEDFLGNGATRTQQLNDRCCHYGGGLDFGPDGKLYLTIGDKWKSDASQDLTQSGGSIIRLNPDGTIPADNPFVDGPGGNVDEIWAYGLRNPFRAEWDLPTGRFFIGDVGGNVQTTAREEINLGIAGTNYGWDSVEGIVNNPLYEDPVFDYGHTGATPAGGAIAGGFVARNSQFPSEYEGAYFFGDYALGWIKYLQFDLNGNVIDADPGTAELDAFDFLDSPQTPVAIEQGADGALYYLNYLTFAGGPPQPGDLHKVVFNNGNLSPTIATATATPTQGTTAPLTVTFSADATDPDMDPLTYIWDFGDGNSAAGKNPPAHTYQSKGYYQATVRVSDGINNVTSDVINITVGQAPVIQNISPVQGTLFRAGDSLTFSAVVTDDDPLDASNYSWTARFIHNAHTHPEFDNISALTVDLEVPVSGHDYSDNTGYEVELTVTDIDGIPTTAIVSVFPEKSDVTIDTDFPGVLTYSLDGLPRVGDFVHDSAIDFVHTLSVPDIVYHNGIQYVFDEWSDGTQTTSNTFTVPATDVALTARYLNNGPAQLITNDLVLRLDAANGVISSGGTVTGWNDQSGQNNDLTAVGNPQLRSAELNGLDYIDFDGAGEKLVRTTNLNGLPAGSADRTVFLVGRYDSLGYGGFSWGDNAANETFGTVVSNTGFLQIQGWGGSNDFASSTVGTGQGWLVQEAVLNSNDLRHYADGVLIDARTHAFNTDVANGNGIALGAEIDGDPFLDMSVAEILVYDVALTDAEREQVGAYLHRKYFVVGSPRRLTIQAPLLRT